MTIFLWLQALEKEKVECQPVIEQLVSSSKPLVEHCQADVGSIENDVSDVQERWDAICSVLHEVQDKIPKMKEAVPVYEEKVKPLEQCLVEANDVLDEVEPFGLDTNKGNEQLNKVKVRHILYIN